MKIKLLNGCSCSNLTVAPKNWHTKAAKVTIKWSLSYRFYDPRYSKPKQVRLRGMNVFKTLPERQAECERLLKSELQKLKDGFNPFDIISTTKLKTEDIVNKEEDMISGQTVNGIENENMTITQALRYALKEVTVAPRTREDLTYTVELVEKALPEVGLEQKKVGELSRKHVRSILKKISTTSDRFNKHRSYLMILFSELAEDEIIDMNPLKDIKKKKTTRNVRTVLTDEERPLINQYLLQHYPSFHRFLHIFYHSGARISELMRLRECDVDLINERFKVTIQKGRVYKQVWKVIKVVVLPYWIEIKGLSEPGDYLFSKGLRPGKFAIQSYQITKRWNRIVKKKLHIQADFYSLKHLHTTEVVELLSIEEAAKHNDHTSTAMVEAVYDVRIKERKQNRIQKLQNKFA